MKEDYEGRKEGILRRKIMKEKRNEDYEGRL